MGMRAEAHLPLHTSPELSPLTKMPRNRVLRLPAKPNPLENNETADITETQYRDQELCESRGGRPGLPSLINLQFLWT